MSFLSRAPAPGWPLAAPGSLAAPADDGPGNPWFSWRYVHDNAGEILAMTIETAKPLLFPVQAADRAARLPLAECVLEGQRFLASWQIDCHGVARRTEFALPRRIAALHVEVAPLAPMTGIPDRRRIPGALTEGAEHRLQA